MNQKISITPIQRSLKTAVLFLVFNRLDTTQQVFEAIRQAKPPRLYIAADGARTAKIGEKEKVQAVRDYIMTSIDWVCEVKTLFRDENLGCKNGVSTAIDWFFDHEEEGIILEDDVVPHPIFFTFCTTMLERYRDNQEIMMITGFNPLGAEVKSNDYFFSNIPNIWGWATWKSRWQQFDKNMTSWPDVKTKDFMINYMPLIVRKDYESAFDAVKAGLIDSWAYIWTYTILKNKRLTIKPYANLIKNIGILGTHSSGKDHNHNIDYGINSGYSYFNNQPNKTNIHIEDYKLFLHLKKSNSLRRSAISLIKILGFYSFVKKIKNLLSWKL